MGTKTKNKKSNLAMVIGAAAYVLIFSGHKLENNEPYENCKGGSERWKQKVLLDDRVTMLNKNVITTTIEYLNSIKTGKDTIKPSTPRGEIEKQIYEVKDCYITEAKLEEDKDIHIVIEDGKGHYMIAEIPDPSCLNTAESKYVSDFKIARNNFLKYQNSFRNYRFNIKGVAFIDKNHAKNPIGNAVNNLELHPVLSFSISTNN